MNAADNLNWLVGRFVQQVAAVRQAVVVSSDGLPLAVSDGVDRETGERLAAVASGMIGLAYGSAGRFGLRVATRIAGPDHQRFTRTSCVPVFSSCGNTRFGSP